MAKKEEFTSIGGQNIQFPETNWTRLLDLEQRQALLEELTQRYWKPVYAYLRRRGMDNEQAKDLTQDFFTDKVLGADFLNKADHSRGKFRTFLLTAVRNYALDKVRATQPTFSLDEERDDVPADEDPACAFNLTWAETILHEVLQELQQECLNRNKQNHWNIFKKWFLDSMGSEKQSMKDVCRLYGVDCPDQAYNMIANLKDRFRNILRRKLRSQVESDAAVDEEIRNFITILTKSASRFSDHDRI